MRSGLTRLRESREWALLSEMTRRAQGTVKDQMMQVEAGADGAYQFFESKGYAAGMSFMVGLLEGVLEEFEDLYETYVRKDGNGEEDE